MPEAPIAFWTRVGGRPGVGLLVFEQVLLLTEASCTLRAAEGPLAGVVTLVAHQVGLLAEALTTLAAEVRLLACVCALVDLQGRPPAEPLPTIHAHKVTPTCRKCGAQRTWSCPWDSSNQPCVLLWRWDPQCTPSLLL